MNTDIYLTTAFAFMTCDGSIAEEEISLIRNMNAQGVFSVNDINNELEQLTTQLNAQGKDFMRSFLECVEQTDLTVEQELKLLRIAVHTIYADNVVEYSEVKFFRSLRIHLHHITDDYILEQIPEIEDFWLEADAKSSGASVEKDYFDSIEFTSFDLKKLK